MAGQIIDNMPSSSPNFHLILPFIFSKYRLFPAKYNQTKEGVSDRQKSKIYYIPSDLIKKVNQLFRLNACS